MKKTIVQLAFIFLSLSMVFISGVSAAIINASSCSQNHVIEAIKRVSAGDTVVVSAGKCTWSSGITVPAGVTLQGAGIGSTVISSDSFLTAVSLSDNSRVTGFEFSNGAAHGSYHQNWVVDYCKMQSAVGLGTVSISSVNHNKPPTGVFHKCTIINIRWVLFGTSKPQDWYDDLPLGATNGVVYFEGCTFNSYGLYTNGIDSNYGGRRVIRFSTIYNQPMGSHGGRAKVARGTRRYEAYRNTISNTTTAGRSNPSYALWTRGGDGVWFDNKCTGTAGGCKYILDFERAYEASKVICAADTGYETAPHPKGGSPDYLCRDGLGAGRDLGLNPKPPNYTFGQESSPIYMWNNTGNGSAGNTYLANGSGAFALEGRDFFLDASSHAGYGKGGVSSGTWANRPVCDASKKNHGYWATDMGGNWNTTDEWGGADGALYVCDGVAIWRLHYTPAPYPHPLLQAGGSAGKRQ